MSDLTGRQLGKYVLERRLGEGGMAAVYSSRHPQFERPVAIKILPPTVGQDPSFRTRFEREGRMIAGLNHPNIIRVYDIDSADGLFYMVMDLLPGGTLEGRLREGSLDRRWSADVIVKVAEALDYAHGRGVVHRDIKPSNILLDAEGSPVLADFGIAKLVQGDGEAGLTAAGTVMGTPAYMAPEQLTGQPPDARSDIYSLGVVLYQLLSGRVPFTGDTMAVISGHLTRQPPALRDQVADLPQALEAVVLQALDKQPENRFKSARVFAQALRNAAADLEPGLVRVDSAAPAAVAPARPASSAGQATVAVAQPPATAGQQVMRYLPIALGVLGVFLLISILAKYWALVVLLVLLIGVGGFLFLFFRASDAGRRAAEATTRAITTATVQQAAAGAPAAVAAPLEASAPAASGGAPAASGGVPAATQALDDTPEVSLEEVPPVAVAPIEDRQATAATPETDEDGPTAAMPAFRESTHPSDEAVPAAAAEEQPPTEAVPAAAAEEQPPTEAVPAAAAEELPPTEAVPAAAAEELPPTEAVPAAAAEEQPPTEAVPAAAAEEQPPTEAVPAAAAEELPPTEAVRLQDDDRPDNR